MLHHLHHHKHGIKQTVFAFIILTVVGAVLYIGANKNFSSHASEANLLADSQEGDVYDLPSFSDGSTSSPNPDAKTVKNSAITPTRPKNLPSFMIKNVVDGNIVILENDQRVRLAGIKAPELDEEWGMQAADYLKSLILKKQIYLQLDTKNPEDTFGRLRAIIYLNNRNINTEMLRAGLAHVYISTPSIIGVGDWSNYEKEAMDGKKGLWSDKKIDASDNGSIIDKLKNYFFPSSSTTAPVQTKPSSYNSFLNPSTTDKNTATQPTQNSTATEKPLPSL